jgi:adenylate cyclase
MQTYLGSYSGERVLDGLVERGDGGMIDCVLVYCDLRESTKLAEILPLDDYLELINQYFDCTAGAVTDHGGEVLKFIGDAVMAIFPIEPNERPTVDMTRAALSAVSEAFDRSRIINEARIKQDRPEISFGIALHVGEVMYGNVGTDQRLDFTIIGPAANVVTRLEGLCKRLGHSVVASDRFAQACNRAMRHVGAHELAGLSTPIDVYTIDS